MEALAAHLQRLPTVDWRRVEEGEAVYLDRCELCHGRAGAPGPTVGRGTLPPRDLSDPALQRSISDDELKVAVAHGRRGMPPLVPPIPAGELDALVAFVRLLSPGYALYDRYCAACHGEDGVRCRQLRRGSVRPTVNFDRAYFEAP